MSTHRLFIDLASKDGTLACTTDSDVLVDTAVPHRLPDNELLPLVESTLNDAGLTYGDLTHLACTTGPGGFTSLRVAVTLANTLADQLAIPVAGIHLSDLYAARLTTQDALWLHSTKRAELFVRGFGAHATQWPEPTHMLIEDFVPVCPERVEWAGELIEQHQEALSSKSPIQSKLSSKKSSLINIMSNLSYTKNQLKPWYGREG